MGANDDGDQRGTFGLSSALRSVRLIVRTKSVLHSTTARAAAEKAGSGRSLVKNQVAFAGAEGRKRLLDEEWEEMISRKEACTSLVAKAKRGSPKACRRPQWGNPPKVPAARWPAALFQRSA